MDWVDIFEALMREAVEEEGWSAYIDVVREDDYARCRIAKGAPYVKGRVLLAMKRDAECVFTADSLLRDALRQIIIPMVGEDNMMSFTDPRVADSFKAAVKLALKKDATWLPANMDTSSSQ